MFIIEKRLPLTNHAENAVIHDYNHDICVIGNSGSKLVEVHAEAAVARNQDGLILGTDCGTDCRTQAEAHGTQSAA